MKTTISREGQIVMPVEFRREDHIETGQEFEIERVKCGEYVLRRMTPPRNEGVIDLLLACPVKDWFVPMDRSETTDDICISNDLSRRRDRAQ